MNQDSIALAANLALTFSFIVGLIFGIVQARSWARDRRERFTMETLRNFQTREFAELIHLISSRNSLSTWKDLQALPVSEQVMYIQFAQEMESLGILVAERFINLDLVDKTLGSFVTTTWEKYKSMFLDMREKIPDPFLGEYFQWLAECIAERMRLHPRRPFFETHLPSSLAKQG